MTRKLDEKQRIEIPVEFYYFHNGRHVMDMDGAECPLRPMAKRARCKLNDFWTLLSKLRCGFCGESHNTFNCDERQIAFCMGLVKHGKGGLVLEDNRNLSLEYKPVKHTTEYKEVEEKKARKIAQDIGGRVQNQDLLRLEVFSGKAPSTPDTKKSTAKDGGDKPGPAKTETGGRNLATVLKKYPHYVLGTKFAIPESPGSKVVSSALQTHVLSSMFAKNSPLFSGSGHFNLVETIVNARCLFCGEKGHWITNCEEYDVFHRLEILSCDKHGYYLRTGKRITLVPEGIKRAPELVHWLEEALGPRAVHPEVVSANINYAASKLELPIWWMWYTVAKCDMHVYHRQRCTGK